MAPLRKMPWSSKSDEDPPRSRPSWYRLRRPEPTTPSSDQPEADTRPQPSDIAHAPESSDSNANAPENIATPSYQEVEIPVDEDSSQHSRCVSAAPETENRSTTSSHSRPPRGPRSLRNILSRFRHNRPREQGAGSETAQPLQTPGTGGRETTTDYTKSGTRDPDSPLARNPPTAEPEATEQQRNVSAQTAESYDSENTSATVHRRPSQRLPAPVLELQQECFSPAFLTDCPPGTGHFGEPSDPFADKKNVEDTITSTARAASKRSSKISSRLSKRSSHAKERTKEASEISQEQDDQIVPAPLSFPNRQSICSSRHGSYTSYSSRTNPLEQSRAARRFNVLAGQHNIETLLDEELPNAEGKYL